MVKLMQLIRHFWKKLWSLWLLKIYLISVAFWAIAKFLIMILTKALLFTTIPIIVADKITHKLDYMINNPLIITGFFIVLVFSSIVFSREEYYD